MGAHRPSRHHRPQKITLSALSFKQKETPVPVYDWHRRFFLRRVRSPDVGAAGRAHNSKDLLHQYLGDLASKVLDVEARLETSGIDAYAAEGVVLGGSGIGV